MCGICGIIGKPDAEYYQDVFDLMSRLYIETEIRGVHATGYAALTSDNKMLLYKVPTSPTEFVGGERWKNAEGRKFPPFFIGHCRQATHGNPKNNDNNHPFKSMDGRYSFVHNGVIRGHRNLAQAESVLLKTECDSELILRIIETEEEPLKGIRKTFERVFSPMKRDGACVLLDSKKSKAHFFRNSMRPLFFIRVPQWNNAIVFASTESILLSAINLALRDYTDLPSPFQIRSGRVYTVGFGTDKEPTIEYYDIPIKIHNTSDYFRSSLPAPSRTQKRMSIVGFDEVPSTAPEECNCPCGNDEWVWTGEWKECSICAEYSLSPGKEPKNTDIAKDYDWLQIHCEECGLTWEQRYLHTTKCIKCGSTWVSVTSVINPVKKTKKASLWSCEKCKARFVGTRRPEKCYKCHSKGIAFDGILDRASLPNNWKTKKCHDCGKDIKATGQSRCGDCAKKRRERRRQKREEMKNDRDK